jgi:hypothetical protein
MKGYRTVYVAYGTTDHMWHVAAGWSTWSVENGVAEMIRPEDAGRYGLTRFDNPHAPDDARLYFL